MPKHLIFFLGALSFLSGILFASLGLSLLSAFIPAAIVFAALYISGESLRLSLCAALLLVAGSFYYLANDYGYRQSIAALPKSGEITGIIASDPSITADSQSFFLDTGSGKIEVFTAPDPAYAYGDSVAVAGKIEPPGDNSYGRYLESQRAAGAMYNPRVTLVSKGGGSRVLAFLYSVKRSARDAFKRFLPPDEAALLTGITLGINDDFSAAFSRNLSLAGVRHLTAVSGLHISIITFIVFALFASFLPRRRAFILTLLVSGFYVAIIGFSISAMRAALMGFIAGLAKETGRVYAAYNALALAALIFALINPMALLFDIGFELSFGAATAMIYLSPLIRRTLRLGNSPGFAGWREILATTLAAEIATAPILIAEFQNFSLTSFAANILILAIVPVLIASGFLLWFASFLAPLASLLSLIVSPLAAYVIFVVNLFARYAATFNPRFGFTGVVIYYGALISLLYRFYKPKPAPFEASPKTAPEL